MKKYKVTLLCTRDVEVEAKDAFVAIQEAKDECPLPIYWEWFDADVKELD